MVNNVVNKRLKYYTNFVLQKKQGNISNKSSERSLRINWRRYSEDTASFDLISPMLASLITTVFNNSTTSSQHGAFSLSILSFELLSGSDCFPELRFESFLKYFIRVAKQPRQQLSYNKSYDQYLNRILELKKARCEYYIMYWSVYLQYYHHPGSDSEKG